MSKLFKVIISTTILIAVMSFFVTGCDFIPTNTAATQTTGNALDMDLIKEANDVISDYYVEPDKIDSEKLTEGAIRGMIDALDDPYSAYMNKEMAEISSSDFQGQFEGIGASVGMDDEGRVIVIAPLEGYPAEKAGIKPGDVILEVDGESLTGLTSTDAVLMIRGAKGTPVELTILHENETEPVIIEIIRDVINMESVSFEMKEDIAYLRITQFTDRTDDELIPYLETIQQNGAEGIIIDLRSNPGGILDTVVDNASHFLDGGDVVHVVYRDGSSNTSSVTDVSPKILDLPIVILVDNYSASGSEVLSGALQDHGRAVIAGNQTFGKGSVNILHSLSDGSAIYITIARWKTPLGYLIEGEGITPDYEIDFEEVDGIEWAIDYIHDNMD